MHIEYRDQKVHAQCTNLRRAKRDFPEKVAKKLFMMINFIESAENLESIKNYPSYHFHQLKGDKKSLFALDIDGRTSQYRLIVSFSSNDFSAVFSEPTSIEVIQVEEVSKHYGK